MRVSLLMHRKSPLRAILGLILLTAIGCRAPLRLPDRTTPRCVAFDFAPGVEDPAGLRADLETAFQPQWQLLSEGSDPPREGILLKVRVTRQVLGSSTSGGNGLLFSGGLILGVGALALHNASGWDTLGWIPVGGVSIPLLVTGLVQKIKTAVMDSRRGYSLPIFKADLWLVILGKANPGGASLTSQDLRDFARPLDQARARDPLEVRRASTRALARYVAETMGLDSPEPPTEP